MFNDLYDATSGNVQSNAVSWSCAGAFSNFTGSGNITNYPAFANPVAGDYHLPAGSPCVNAGLNAVWMDTARDLDGHRRIDRFSGHVDMGAYEFSPAGSMFIVH